MLRIHFTDADLARIRLAAEPDPLWETALSLHRFQIRRGQWAYTDWHRETGERLREQGLWQVVRTVLLPLFPRAAYFPDFLNPAAAAEGLEAGLEAVVATPGHRVMHEVGILDRVVGAPAWAAGLGDMDRRRELAGMIRSYYHAAVAPYGEQVAAHLDAERSYRGRSLISGGAEHMLAGFSPLMRWDPPVLHVTYPVERDLRLDGRGLLLIPSYFCWQTPVALADPELPPVLVYPLHHKRPSAGDGVYGTEPLGALLGHTCAAILSATAAGATTGELARAAGVSASCASHHTGVLRKAGLISSNRHATCMLHTLTPLGASVLRGPSEGGSVPQGSRQAPRPPSASR
jgi:DNA-binding transcriptional ArsR family regulator